ncbi:MAG TPA: YggS family pyridoxal phosphate-dependent enzyme [Lentisphaerae bacterium]|nr:YggS family pyridoxal phosphate-dependent enzyme [Lentisphaerota bacterium]
MDGDIDYEAIRRGVEEVRGRIAEACRRAGRDPGEVTLIAVSKGHPPEAVRAAHEAGMTIFGENRVQEASQKIPLCPSSLVWHMVGHLQRNKVRKALPLFEMIHSVDSLRLVEALERECSRLGKVLPVLIEVNVAGESSKYGIAPENLRELLDAAAGCGHLEVRGLMTMPPWSPDPEKVRPYFARLRELLVKAGEEWGHGLVELSMGMSADFEVAIEEGATMVRIGTAIFGRRPE